MSIINAHSSSASCSCPIAWCHQWSWCMHGIRLKLFCCKFDLTIFKLDLSWNMHHLIHIRTRSVGGLGCHEKAIGPRPHTEGIRRLTGVFLQPQIRHAHPFSKREARKISGDSRNLPLVWAKRRSLLTVTCLRSTMSPAHTEKKTYLFKDTVLCLVYLHLIHPACCDTYTNKKRMQPQQRKQFEPT